MTLHEPEFPIVVADELGIVDRFATVEEALKDYPEATEFQGAGDTGFTYWGHQQGRVMTLLIAGFCLAVGLYIVRVTA